MRYNEIIVEGSKLPHNIKSIQHDIIEVKSILWGNDLSLDQIALILSDVLGKYSILFNEVYTDSDSQYSAVGLDGGQTDVDGTVTLNYTRNLQDFMSGDSSHHYYEDFVRLLISLIGHELQHREQLQKSYHNSNNIPNPENNRKYLSDHREIESYATQASLELLAQFSKEEVLYKIKSSSGLDELSLYSEGIKWYIDTFESGELPFIQFLRKLYAIVVDTDE